MDKVRNMSKSLKMLVRVIVSVLITFIFLDEFSTYI